MACVYSPSSIRWHRTDIISIRSGSFSHCGSGRPRPSSSGTRRPRSSSISGCCCWAAAIYKFLNCRELVGSPLLFINISAA